MIKSNINHLSKAIVTLLLLTASSTVFGWGMTGHRVISEIAETHLSKKAKKNIYQLVGNQKLAYWSNWADFIKSDPNPELQKTGSWHFVNTSGNLSYTDFVTELKASPDDNLYKAYAALRKDAKARQGDLASRQQQLYFIIHLLADAHQPMHVSRKEDLGGNLINVTFFGRKSNIHRVWDSDLVDNEKYSYTEYARVLDFDKNNYAKHTQSSLEEWLYESHQLANEIYDDVAKDNNLSYKYIFNYKSKMESCLLKAGLRLAKELNDIYG
ncbi:MULTISPECIES: S1/P1 nuclease [Sphingobacterium]|uniref:S1/P1 nuclease n=1 Tax=Sphingobacterium populi TaxID=1812824 RepID=A0ABW5UEW6_9SPHI|nr:S1/P1 nuclease [Sphingobacterium sp. CFCC 11742]